MTEEITKPHLAKKLETAEEFLQALKDSGGNIYDFCRRNSTSTFHDSWLFLVYETLKKSPDIEKQWGQVVEMGQKCRLDYLQSKVMDFLNDFDDVTKGVSAAEANSKISYCKTILIDVLASRVETAKRRASFPYIKYLKDSDGTPGDTAADETETIDDYIETLTKSA